MPRLPVRCGTCAPCRIAHPPEPNAAADLRLVVIDPRRTELAAAFVDSPGPCLAESSSLAPPSGSCAGQRCRGGSGCRVGDRLPAHFRARTGYGLGATPTSRAQTFHSRCWDSVSREALGGRAGLARLWNSPVVVA
jgi:hypothetical protein